MIKVLIAIRIHGVDVHDLIQAHRRHLVEVMQQWTRVKEDAGQDELNLLLVLDAELFRLDSVIRWLDTADSRLRRHSHDEAVAPAAPPASPLPGLRRTIGTRR